MNTQRHIIDMDGTTHGPDGSGADCEHDGGFIPQMECGFNCGKCKSGVVHRQPIYAGYYYKCDFCEHEGISPTEFL